MLADLAIGFGLYLLLGAVTAAVTGRFSFFGWLYQVFLVLDQAINVFGTPFHIGAWADETMSARAWRAFAQGKLWGRAAKPVIDWIFAWQKAPGGHCRQAYERERARMHLPPELRA